MERINYESPFQSAANTLLEGPVGASLHQRITLVRKEATCLKSFMVTIFPWLGRTLIDIANRTELLDLNVCVISEW